MTNRQLCAIKWALLKGASKVYAIDTVPTRLAMAKAIGPQVVTVDFKAEDVTKTIHEAVPGGLDGMSRSYKCFMRNLTKSLYRRHHFPRTQDYAPQS